MTTESLCTINSNSKSNNSTGHKQDQQHQHQRQQQQQQQKEQKQTIGGITEAFKTTTQEDEEEAVTSSATTTLSKVLLLEEEKEAQISTKTNNIKRDNTKCYIETLKNQDIDEREGKENRNLKEKSPFIDSRSILNNKENLKRFWEHKMEMDIKLRQQQELSCKPKVVSFDNNNNNSTATTNSNEEYTNSKEQQQQAASDEEWRSLSPNEEPSRFDINNKQQNLNRSNQIVSSKKENTKQHQQQQVSAKLICEKLRDYQANDGEGALAAKRRAENHHRLGITAKNATHLKDKQPIENGLLNSRKNNNEEKTESQDNKEDKLDDRCENYVPKSANGHNDEIQLMSIDPTLCHSSESINDNNNSNTNNSSKTNNNNNNNDDNDDNNTRSDIKQIESATTIANESIMNESTTTNEQTEEQTVNEEFSSSNSSFGPMSISMPRQEDLCLSNVSSNDLNVSSSHNTNQVETDTEDEPNSTQSGSVLTVIAKLDQENRNDNITIGSSNRTNNLSPSLNDNNQKSLSWNGSSFDQNTLTSSEINEEEDEEERKNENENEDEDDDDDEEEEEEEESGSNIGVAFESLHFDNDIKSSKQEQVDDELLIAPSAPIPVKRPTVSKFNASEVRSVCNFISAAISDATKQVENYMNLGNSNTTLSSNSSKKEANHKVIKDVRDINDNYIVNDDDDDDDNVDVNEQQDVDYEESSQNNNSSSSIQRATFVRESQEFHTTNTNNSNHPIDNLSPNEDQQELIDIETQHENKSQVISENTTTASMISHLEEGEGEEEEQEEIECVDETIPAADLSSIFEANVRREIERFETNSNIKKSNGGKYAIKNSLTEWRIAEEIRLFNAREMELKKRFEDSSRSSRDTNTNTNNNNNNNNNNSSNLKQQLADNHSKRQNQQHEAIVRFGKTLQLPKVSNMDPSSSSSSSSTSTSMSNLSKSIKLSTTATSTNNSSGQQQQQQTTMISMHKFIASGGKRFVFTNTSSSQNNNTTTLQNNLFTKSMSNLSTTSTTSGTSKQRDETIQRVVDYKAVDSLKCKETPNVKPGIARKVIETFSRMQSSQDSLSNHRVNDQASQQNNVITRQYLQQQQQQPQQVSSSSSSSCLSNTAEWKIQEELREMRAREAELRDQRSQMLVNSSLLISHSNNQDELLSSNGLCNGEGSENHLNVINNDSGGHEMTASGDELKKESLGNLSFSSECLYPIKQTIDSFRKLNSSSQQASASTNNNFAQSTPHQNINNNNNNNYYSALKVEKKIIQTTGRTEQQQNVSPDDYDSKVGGQRRKISMIEKWENKMY